MAASTGGVDDVTLSLAAELRYGFGVASDVLDATNSTLEIDPLLERMAVRADEASYAVAIRVLVEALRAARFSAIREIAQYFAYRFKWPEFRTDVEALLAEARSAGDLRKARSLETVLEAFDDGWEDLEFFPSLERGACGGRS